MAVGLGGSLYLGVFPQNHDVSSQVGILVFCAIFGAIVAGIFGAFSEAARQERQKEGEERRHREAMDAKRLLDELKRLALQAK